MSQERTDDTIKLEEIIERAKELRDNMMPGWKKYVEFVEEIAKLRV